MVVKDMEPITDQAFRERVLFQENMAARNLLVCVCLLYTSGLVKPGGTGHGMTVPHKQEGRGLPGFSQQDKGVIRHIPQLRICLVYTSS